MRLLARGGIVLIPGLFFSALAFLACDRAPNIASRISSNPEALPFGPFRKSLPAVEQGAELFRRYGCHLCHGERGEKGIKNANLQTGGEVLGLTRVADGYTKNELRKKIVEGVRNVPRQDPEGPVPPYRMPGWQGYITSAETDALVEYLFSLIPKDDEGDW